MLADFVSEQISWTFRELVIRNWGEQDAYPRYVVLSKNSLEKQGESDVDQALQKLGIPLSKSYSYKKYQVVPPTDPDDVLQPDPQLAGAIGTVAPSLSGKDKGVEKFAMAPRGLYHAAAAKAKTVVARRDSLSTKSKAAAKPAITSVVKAVGSGIRRRKSLDSVSHASMIRSVDGHPSVGGMAGVFSMMLGQSGDISMAAPSDQKKQDAANTATALEIGAILAAITSAVNDAPNGMPPADFADSLTDPNGIGIDERFHNLFSAVHDTDIASIDAANLRAQLADPKFRADYPYLMRVVTNPNARASHRLMDGYVMNAEDASYSGNLAPLDFGCDCVDVPISAEDASANGITGALPTGSLDAYAKQQGASPFSPVGRAPGFVSAGPGVHMDVQLSQLRQKAEELRAKDPEAWLAWSNFIVGLFGFNPLTQDQKESN